MRICRTGGVCVSVALADPFSLRRHDKERKMPIFSWFATTLRQYPEIAIFIALAAGY
jgi:hypothetical protein